VEDAVKDIIVRPVGGSAVVATAAEQRNISNPYLRTYVVSPTAPLAPATSYEIASKVKPSCDIDCVSASYELLGTFTTGSGPDTTPPTFAGANAVKVFDAVICDNTACCGPYTGIPVQVDIGSATDESGVAAYYIYVDGQRVSVYGTRGLAICSGSISGGGAVDWVNAQSGRYVVHAVDLAGNEDTNDFGAQVALDCAAVTAADAGVSDAAAPDAGASDAATPDGPAARTPDAAFFPTDGNGGTSGCAVGGGHGAPASGLLLLLGLIVGASLARIRRRLDLLPAHLGNDAVAEVDIRGAVTARDLHHDALGAGGAHAHPGAQGRCFDDLDHGGEG
jgi:hypothetical protein